MSSMFSSFNNSPASAAAAAAASVNGESADIQANSNLTPPQITTTTTTPQSITLTVNNPIHQLISASVGAALTSFSMTPFDVVKTRMQAGLLDANNSTWGMQEITKKEGLTSLWRGLTPTLVLSLPQTAFYFMAYEHLRDRFGSAGLKGGSGNAFLAAYSPAIAGALARSFAVTLISPLELIRTRIQGSREGLASVVKETMKQTKSQGVLFLWRGLGPTLLRDAPFSAIYWASLELLKGKIASLKPVRTYSEDLGASFVAGSISGIIAAICTHPFDVIKTLYQVSPDDSGNPNPKLRPPPEKVSIWRNLYLTKGFSGFWAGLAPRVVKAAPACGIMISTYEVGATAEDFVQLKSFCYQQLLFENGNDPNH